MGCLLAYAGCVRVLALLERRLLGAALPVAAVLFALQNWSIDYATSGMETGLATLWVLLGLLALVKLDGPRSAALAGLALIAAAFTRPDHGLFWAAGGLAVLVELRPRSATGWRRWLPERPAWSSLLAYGASFLPYAAYLAWKLQYYGEWLPNTYYAKSAGLTYFSQGGLYALSFLLGAHLWVLLPLAVWGLAAPARGRAQRLLRSFCIAGLLVYNLYVLKVGGDFMVGRFYVVTLPLWLLLAHHGLRRLLAARRAKAILAAAALAATVGGVEILAPGPGIWNLSHEASHYRVEQWFPRVVIRHHNWRAANNLMQHLGERGIHPILATSGIGMVGYYSGMEVIDVVGLTDPVVAHRPLTKRGMPGHEKHARQQYLDRRGVQLIRARAYRPKRWSEATAVNLGDPKTNEWHFHRYDAALADQIEQLAPEIGFERFEPQLDRWVHRSIVMSLEEVQRDIAFFERFYFCCNDDPVRRERVDRALEFAEHRAATQAESQAVSPKESQPPAGPSQPPVALDAQALVALDLPTSSRPDGAATPVEVPCGGPWKQVWRDGEIREYRTRLPVDQVYLGESVKQEPVGMKLLDDRGVALPYHLNRKALGPEARSWRVVGQELFVRGPGLAPEPGSLRIRYPRAATWEDGLNLGPTTPPSPDFALRRTGLVNDDQQGLLLPSPGSATWQFEVPHAGVLAFQAKILRPAVDVGARSDGVELVVEIEDGGATRRLASIAVAPDTDWISHRVDLAELAGRDVQLTLRSLPGDDALLDYLFLAQPTVYSPQPAPRRVVLVFVDTLRRDHMGLYGYQAHDTMPWVDSWAESAVVFEHARSAAPWTLPSVRALLSAELPTAWSSSVSLPEQLSGAGFATAFFCANPYLRPNFDMDRGWSRYRFELMAPAKTQVDQALGWLESHPDRDAAVMVQFMDPHMPYSEPKAYRSLWAPDKPAAFHGTIGPDSLKALDPTSPDHPAIQEWVVARYDQNLRYVDDQVQRLIEAAGEDAVVVFFSDHGEEFWDHGGVEHGHSVYEELLAVPLVIKAPGLPSGHVQEPVSLMDVGPTVLDLLGVPHGQARGRTLLPAMHGDPAALAALAARPLAFGQTLYGDEAWGVLQGDAKWWVHGSQEHLHDLSADPGERDDLASAPEHRTEPWVQRLATALAQPVLPVWRIQGQGLRKTTSQRQGSATVSHPGGFVQAWSTPGIKRQTAEPQLTPGGAVVTASKQLPVPREWYVQPSALDASPQGLTLVVERGEQRWQASVGEGAHPGGLLLEAGEGELSYQITRAWAPRFEQETETELDAETREQLRVLGYVE